jgi:hypothetical protein
MERTGEWTIVFVFESTADQPSDGITNFDTLN